MSPFVTSLIHTATLEWDFFGKQYRNLNGTTNDGLRETDDGAWQRIGVYWKRLGGPYSQLTGKNTAWPWSAAFISFVMGTAGAGSRFMYSASHSTYINDAIKRRNENNKDGAFFAYQVNEQPLRPGDLLGYWRGQNEVNFESALDFGSYPSHTDIVVSVSGQSAFLIGGNVSNGVTRTEVKTTPSGMLADTRKPWFIVMRNLL